MSKWMIAIRFRLKRVGYKIGPYGDDKMITGAGFFTEDWNLIYNAPQGVFGSELSFSVPRQLGILKEEERKSIDAFIATTRPGIYFVLPPAGVTELTGYLWDGTEGGLELLRDKLEGKVYEIPLDLHLSEKNVMPADTF